MLLSPLTALAEGDLLPAEDPALVVADDGEANGDVTGEGQNNDETPPSLIPEETEEPVSDADQETTLSPEPEADQTPQEEPS